MASIFDTDPELELDDELRGIRRKLRELDKKLDKLAEIEKRLAEMKRNNEKEVKNEHTKN